MAVPQEVICFKCCDFLSPWKTSKGIGGAGFNATAPDLISCAAAAGGYAAYRFAQPTTTAAYSDRSVEGRRRDGPAGTLSLLSDVTLVQVCSV
ncbi:hypothetical protein PAMP_008725 [Pampus punctatissimus]